MKDRARDLLSLWASKSRPLPPAVLVAAHSDDETVGASSRLPHFRNGLLVHVTDSAPRSMGDAHAAGCGSRREYARVRSEECDAALAVAGLDSSIRRQLEVVDQEASHHLVEIARRLAELIAAFRPACVLTHPYEGGHPDHDAAAFAVRAACRLLRDQGDRSPCILEFTSYHNSAGSIQAGEFLPNSCGPVWTRVLDRSERSLKQRMLDCYRTQRTMLQQFPLVCERFRAAPDYDFTMPPHPGILFYEQFDWGMTGDRWRRLARVAEAGLRMDRVCR